MCDRPGTSLLRRLKARAARLDWMMIFPVVAAIAWAFGQDAVAMVLVLIVPLCVALDLKKPTAAPLDTLDLLARDQPLPPAVVQHIVDDVLKDCARRARTTAVLHIEVVDLHVADGGWCADAGDRIMSRLADRLGAALRGQDAVMRMGDDAMVMVLAPTRRADLDVLMAIVDRIQAAVAEPFSVEGRAVRVRCCIGMCSETMAPARSGSAMLAAAGSALRIARRQGDDSVRAFNADIQTQVEIDNQLSSQVEAALDAGQICPWFQPQVDTRSGTLAGFESLARWHHPDLGVLDPEKFLSTIAATGRSADMGDKILDASLTALVEWDKAGIAVPCVGVNVSLEQLTDPRLAERIIWQIDRYDVAPHRIAIEILESATLRDGDETIMRNIKTLRTAGLRLDLDEFGTGAASIAHIAQFGVHRIKIDRNFIHNIDRDDTQREVVAAILGLAERLSIATLAEGVETPEEQATLADMGCPHVQGCGIARPMPFEETIPWALSLQSRRAELLRRMQPHGSA